ncbi:uncharacterized protein G2W53_041272 [Senna tora]|uniref:Uncharacterized protein n=1 Tax=Senna tora TaxID=362788 RepID=A0A834W178_9FABA|nr:uncharacterized protein G2W53_041272 [Senna tora]
MVQQPIIAHHHEAIENPKTREP